mmetsp:Transcript_373/g.699  ORF Transcript_373/g.699 Transcript_373/m.699 type:complete len:203 (-) Transcript_373:424-1032(-)
MRVGKPTMFLRKRGWKRRIKKYNMDLPKPSCKVTLGPTKSMSPKWCNSTLKRKRHDPCDVPSSPWYPQMIRCLSRPVPMPCQLPVPCQATLPTRFLAPGVPFRNRDASCQLNRKAVYEMSIIIFNEMDTSLDVRVGLWGIFRWKPRKHGRLWPSDLASVPVMRVANTNPSSAAIVFAVVVHPLLPKSEREKNWNENGSSTRP